MKSQNRNRPGDVVQVRTRDWNGNLIDNYTANSYDKYKGALIVGRLKTIFDLTEEEIKLIEEKEDAIIKDGLIDKDKKLVRAKWY